jgi:hypothetical protein
MLIGPRERLGYRTWDVRLSEQPRRYQKGPPMISRQEFVLGAVWGVLFWVACQAVGFGFEGREDLDFKGGGFEIAYAPALLEGVTR